MNELKELLIAYEKYGATGVFLLLYVLTIYYFYKELKDRNLQIALTTERVVSALDKASDSMEQTARINQDVGRSLDNNTKQTAEFIAFIRGRDQGKNG